MSNKDLTGVADYMQAQQGYVEKENPRIDARKDERRDARWFVVFLCIFFFSLFGMLFNIITLLVHFPFKQITVPTEVETVTPVEESNIDAVYFVVDGYEYTDIELLTMTSLPTVISVRVVYKDGSELYKSAYVCYDDVDSVVYEDNAYGKIVLPQ